VGRISRAVRCRVFENDSRRRWNSARPSMQTRPPQQRCAWEIERIAALQGAELLAAAVKGPQWRNDFEAIGELPRADQRGLQSRFETALRLCQTRVTDTRALDRQQSFDHLLEAARHIQAYGYAVAQKAAPDELEALKLAAETFVAAFGSGPKGAAPLLRKRGRKPGLRRVPTWRRMKRPIAPCASAVNFPRAGDSGRRPVPAPRISNATLDAAHGST